MHSGIPFSAMRSGVWKIIVSGDQIAVQRSITLTVGVPQTTTVIVRFITCYPCARPPWLTHRAGHPHHRSGNHNDAEGQKYVSPTPVFVRGRGYGTGALILSLSAILTTIQQTQTLILVPATISAACNGGTQTVTNYNQGGGTQTVTSTIVRTATDGARTSQWTTTMTTGASCHYPTSASSSEKKKRLNLNV